MSDAPHGETIVRCTNCNYDVSRSDRSGNCTECGVPIERTFECHAFAIGPAGTSLRGAAALMAASILTIPAFIVAMLIAAAISRASAANELYFAEAALSCVTVAVLLTACAAIRYAVMPVEIQGVRPGRALMATAALWTLALMLSVPLVVVIVLHLKSDGDFVSFAFVMVCQGSLWILAMTTAQRLDLMRASLLHAARSRVLLILVIGSAVADVIAVSLLSWLVFSGPFAVPFVLIAVAQMMGLGAVVVAIVAVVVAVTQLSRLLRVWRKSVAAAAKRAPLSGNDALLSAALVSFVRVAILDCILLSAQALFTAMPLLAISFLLRLVGVVALRRIDVQLDRTRGAMDRVAHQALWIWCASPLIVLVGFAMTTGITSVRLNGDAPIFAEFAVVGAIVAVGGTLAISACLLAVADSAGSVAARWWCWAAIVASIAFAVSRLLSSVEIRDAEALMRASAPARFWLLAISAAFSMRALRRSSRVVDQGASTKLPAAFIALGIALVVPTIVAFVAPRFGAYWHIAALLAQVGLAWMLWRAARCGSFVTLLRTLAIIALGVGVVAQFLGPSPAWQSNDWWSRDGFEWFDSYPVVDVTRSTSHLVYELARLSTSLIGVALLIAMSDRLHAWRGSARLVFILALGQTTAALVSMFLRSSGEQARACMWLLSMIGDVPILLCASLLPFMAREALARPCCRVAPPMPPLLRDEWKVPPITRLDAGSF